MKSAGSRRRWWAPLLVCAVLGIAVTVAPSTPSEAADVVATWTPGAPCPDIIVYGFRGSGQERDSNGTFTPDSATLGLGPEIYNVAKRLSGAPAHSIAVFASRYPAIPVSELGSDTLDIWESVDRAREEARVVTAAIAKCPAATRVVFAGYSQGAMAARAGVEFIREEDRGRVGAVLLMADPGFDPNAGGVMFGGFDKTKAGLTGPAPPPDWARDRTVHGCVPRDLVCQSSGNVDLLSNAVTQHFTEPHNTQYKTVETSVIAASLVAERLWGSATPNPSSSPGGPSGVEQPTAGQPILFVFDTSGSMSDADADGKTKLDGAKSSATNVIYDLPTTAKVGVWAFPQGGGCEPGISALNVNTLDRSTLTAKIQSLQPDGNTPTATALRAATDSLKAQGYTAGTIVLVSDGLANCDADPCETAQEITDEGFDLTVNTAGFLIDEEGRQQLDCIANATGGRYVDVTNADDLTATLAAASQAALQLNVTGLDATARTGGSHTVTATVSNTNPSVTAVNASVSLSFTDGNLATYPAVLPPRAQLGNIPPNSSRTHTWTISTGGEGRAYPRLVAQARGVMPIQKTGTISIQTTATIAEAGSILKDASRIAIIGDSFSSGEGTKNYVDMDTASKGCHRSLDAYALHLYSVTDKAIQIACSGAVVHDYLYPNIGRGRAAQAGYLSDLFRDKTTTPQVVMLTFGGNDIGFAELVTKCALAGDCTTKKYYDKSLPKDQQVPFSLPERKYAHAMSMVEPLTKVYEAIGATLHNAAPKGTPQIPIIVLPYAQVVTDTASDSCSNLNNNERKFAVQLLQTLNKSIKEAVAAARAQGVPVYYAEDVIKALLPGHTACAATEEERYVNDLSAGEYIKPQGEAPQEMMHPDVDGHRAITNSLIDWSTRPEVETQWATDKTAAIGTGTNWFLHVGVPTTLTTDNTLDMGQLDGTTNVSTGGQLTIQGSGYAPNSNALIVVRSNPQTLGTATADDSGNVTATVTIPTDLPRGPHTIDMEGFDPAGDPLLLQQSITVQPATPLWVPLIGLIALSALAAAITLQLRGRRQRTRTHGPAAES